MLAKLAPRFVISRVIQNAYYAEFMAVELTKQIIGESAISFTLHDAKKYYECNFYGYISSLAPPTDFHNQFQADKYKEAVQKFALYNSVRSIYQKLDEFAIELRELYRGVEASNTSSNFFARSSTTDEVFEEDLKDALTRYHNFLEKLEAYPEWREKVVEEVGKIFLMIHNNLAEGDTKRSLFEQLNRQEYFV